MTDPKTNPNEARVEQEPKQEESKGRMAGSMHENSPEWSDPVCPCEAEPYWTDEEEGLGHENS